MDGGSGMVIQRAVIGSTFHRTCCEIVKTHPLITPTPQASSGSSGRVRVGGQKHEIYVAAFGGHLFYDLFSQGRGGLPPRPPLDPLLQASVRNCPSGTIATAIYYRPQTKFGQGKVFTPMCHSVGVGVEGSALHPRTVCLGGLYVGGATSPHLASPSTTGYGQQAGCTHPTGMHSCLSLCDCDTIKSNTKPK